jgi:hypothetical protein
MRDADIDNSDIPKPDKSFWKTAKLTMAEPKDGLTIRCRCGEGLSAGAPPFAERKKGGLARGRR